MDIVQIINDNKFIIEQDCEFTDTKRKAVSFESENKKYFFEGLMTIIPHYKEAGYFENGYYKDESEIIGVTVHLSIQTFCINDEEVPVERKSRKEAEYILEQRIQGYLEDNDLTKGTTI